jgi:hypothetical protein
MKCGLYGIYEMNCGLNAGKQEKQTKKLTPAAKLGQFPQNSPALPIARLYRQHRP